ncbi:MAG TPA: hypothetical protein VNA25_18745 [Phycisphaerae bacterium]|nr:hypothetical protein [Phycisphaerae bacterium]
MSERDRHAELAYRALYARHSSEAELLATADAVCSAWTPLHGSLFGLSLSSREVVGYLSSGRRKTRGFSVRGDDLLRVELPVEGARGLPRGGRARAYLLVNPSDHMACLLGFPADHASVWVELRRYMLSSAISVYLRTEEFRQSLLPLSRIVRVTGFTANVLWDGSQRVKTRREWFPVQKDVQEFFGELEEERQWLRSIELVVKDADQESSGRIKRDLTFSCQKGLSGFWRTALQAVRTTAGETRGIYEKRDVQSARGRAARPLEIRYESAVFNDKRQNRRLIRVLRTLSDSGLSVFHPNPFLHAGLLDYSDGSTYTIWVTDNCAIKIIPGVRASARSLGRLCNHINECFEEGSIEEAPL